MDETVKQMYMALLGGNGKVVSSYKKRFFNHWIVRIHMSHVKLVDIYFHFTPKKSWWKWEWNK